MSVSEFSPINAGELAALIKEGSPALFPTDTLPALGALPKFASKLWTLKRRPRNKPLILMGSTSEELLDLVSPSALDDAWEMAKKYWPGALTLVLPSFSDYLRQLNLDSDSIGMRVPDSDYILPLLKMSGPLATTSANISGESPCLNAKSASKSFSGVPILGPLPWPKFSGAPSTVIAWEGTKNWKLLRQGSIDPFI